ncbi:helix-turn-helix domain-containing protein [Stenotrophomonas maltophilia]|nr:helix-turn-helix domain-containing protein [Stenotrophomonas maltophilia]MBH1434525.1 helix-turn-helix domain-containing protein [Stenotrophomonas maltophilia]
MNPIAIAIEKSGAGQAGIARLLGVSPQAVNQWVSGIRPVPSRHVLAIEAASGISRHELLPEVFGPGPDAVAPLSSAASGCQAASALVDSRMSKRALGSRLGLSSDAHLAKVLGLPVEQISGWADEDMVPALPQVMKLLGHPEQQEPAKPANEDPDADRIAPIEVA